MQGTAIKMDSALKIRVQLIESVGHWCDRRSMLDAGTVGVQHREEASSRKIMYASLEIMDLMQCKTHGQIKHAGKPKREAQKPKARSK